MSSKYSAQIAKELNIPEKSVESTLTLLGEGNTIPFIARYRKEVTGSLDELQVRDLKERADYLKEMDDRRETIVSSIESQGKMTDDLRLKIQECQEKNVLEDLYLPYKPKRRTKATIAKEKGLEPLALRIMEQPFEGDPNQEAMAFISVEKEVENVEAALQGARHIVAEWISEQAEVRAYVREVYTSEGVLFSTVRDDHKDKETKFQQYYKFSEPLNKIPSHRYLAIRRGENEGVLSTTIEINKDPIHLEISKLVGIKRKSPFAEQFSLSIEDSFKRLISPSVETDVRVDFKIKSDKEAIEIFAENLNHLLLSAPMGSKNVIGIDPGYRSGCKCAALSETGKFLETITIYPTIGSGEQSHIRRQFLAFIMKYRPIAIAIGNGTASRETEQFVKETFKEAGIADIIVVQVSESGASVYSASDTAREEFPELDLTIRGAISIGRRLQDPLAELVKVEPKALGVGQYQHDVYQPFLEKKLNDVVESCVNKVGVDINTASASLLAYVAGIGASLGKKIVAFRDKMGAFNSRQQLLEVPGLGPRAFEQCAGFLRIRDASHPLDGSAVHPERYSLVTQMAKDLNVTLQELIGNDQCIKSISIEKYKTETVGTETLQDIVSELKKPGRDPRKSFEMPKFREDVSKIEDLKKDMVIEGIVTNVTAFGAFVDIGVHQDGLVHISELSEQFIDHPGKVVKAGDKIMVKVMDINLNLKRINLTARLNRSSSQQVSNDKSKDPKFKQPKPPAEKFGSNPFANIF
jgi:uncharacterized protein